VRRAFVAALLLVACRRPAAAPPHEHAPADLALAAGWSHGFGAGQPSAQQPVSPKKTPAPPTASAGDEDEDDLPRLTLPPELAKRPAPASGVAVWVDGTLARTLTAPDLANPRRLDAAIGRTTRAVLVHGDRGDEWIAAGELAHFQLRMNRRGKVKLEPAAAPGGSAHGSRAGGRNDQPAQPGRDSEVRGVHWIEARTPKSAKLPGEPPK
jgi:hypothetical protein